LKLRDNLKTDTTLGNTVRCLSAPPPPQGVQLAATLAKMECPVCLCLEAVENLSRLLL
jgi:hypothetical protein